MASHGPSIAIVGGGLGGFATAAALQKVGFDVEVFERTRELGEIGSGINVSQQAIKGLYASGLAGRLDPIGNRIENQIHRSMYTGEQLSKTELMRTDAVEGRFTAPYYAFHRRDLLDALAGAVDPSRVHLNHLLVDLSESKDGVELVFENGVRRTFDFVIGADGIRSRVREALYGEQPAEFTGQVAWRALVSADVVGRDILGPNVYSWVGKGSHVMTYYVRGREQVNLTTQLDSDEWVGEGWSIPGDAEELRAAFPELAPTLRKIIDSVDVTLKWGLFGRQPSFDWGHGRVQLIGDAAHPMLPNAGQGASQAFEDAYVLSRWLDAGRDDPEQAFASFRNVRIPRAHAVQRQSLANSKLVHAGDWEQRQAAFEERKKSGDTPLGMSWIYDYEPEREWNIRQEYPLSTPLTL
ncbi:MAG TPA: FAD-dependent monooxygenase [Pseudolysinimonas sp.]|nr:FAD-dependent monooxygenase [Pseudolysinimonas sp.]